MFVTVKARVIADSTGSFVQIPVLLTATGILQPLLEYLIAKQHVRSTSWMLKVNYSVTLFLRYLESNLEQPNTYLLFQNFAQRLYTGSHDFQTGIDSSGLSWKRRSSKSAGEIITQLTDFFEWLCNNRVIKNTINPHHDGTAFDRRLDESAFQFRRDKAFLGHTWHNQAGLIDAGHWTRIKKETPLVRGDQPAFPEERFEELLAKGFTVGGRKDYRGMLITLLLHGGGLRISEPFHLFIGDVTSDPVSPKSALVLVHHPTYGQAPGDWKDPLGNPRKGNRANYLSEKFALVPRTDLLNSKKSGWKNPTCDAKWYLRVHWFHPIYGEWFLAIWRKYMHQVAEYQRDHPFAWINLDREPKGQMYCYDKFREAHARACEKIGLIVGKHLGTTPHGHRHAYGRRLQKADVGSLVTQRAMHHASPDSQAIYTQKSMGEVMSLLKRAAQRLDDTEPARSRSQLPL